jgi:hypothetical protein
MNARKGRFMDLTVNVSSENTQRLGYLFRRLQPKAEDFLDKRFFPPPEENPEDVARFFFFMTGIDHRTSPVGQSFEGIIDEEYFQGADLLWHLALRRFRENPRFFEAHTMAQITATTVKQWLTVANPIQVTIRNPTQRAELLRDCGQKLARGYNGSVLTLLNQAENKLVNTSATHVGLLDHLSRFKAYEDPARKKSFLLLKFLVRRKLWAIDDPENLRIPVDNHLIRIALRTGVVQIPPHFEAVLRDEQGITATTDIALRTVIAEAFKEVASYAGHPVLELDDFLWHFGRLCCKAESPICETGCSSRCYVATDLLSHACDFECPLSESCAAYSDTRLRVLKEPKVDTFYY